METQEARSLYVPGDTVAVYGLWVAPVPRRLEKYFDRPHCVWLAIDTARLKEDGTPGNLRPLPLWAPPTSWPISEFDQSVLQLVMPFYQEHSRLISSAHARGVPIQDKLLGRVLGKLRTTPFLYGEARRPIEIHPDRPVRQVALSPWAAPVLTEEDGSPLPGNAILLGQDPCWVFVGGAFRPVEEGERSDPEGDDVSGPTAISLLEDREIKVHPAVPPRPRLTLHEEGDRLVARLTLVYGSAFPIAAADPRRFVPGEWEGEMGSFPRDPAAETRILERLARTSLEVRTNGVFQGSGDAALDFLLDDVPELLEEGWEIFGEERLTQLRVTRKKPRVSVSVSSGIDWFEVKSEITLDGGILDENALREALRGRSRYVRLGNGQYARLPGEWLSRQRNLSQSLGAENQGQEGTLVQRLPGYLALAAEDLLEAADEAQVDPRWEAFRDLLAGDIPHPEVPVPASFNGELRPYQRKGLDFMNFIREQGLHGILADDMGLGKTIQAIALMLHEKEAGRLGPSLLVVPTSVIYNWEQELKRFAPTLKTLVLHGPGRRHAMPLMSKVDVVITSYTLLRRDLAELRSQPWYLLFLDEAQNIKNPHSQSARAARALQSRHRFCLTGTPLENHPLELWSLFQFLMPGLLGSERAFRTEYMGGDALVDQARWEKLRRRTRPFILRRLKQEVATDLPPRSEMVAYCELGPEQRRLYNQTLVMVRSGVFETIEREGVGRAHLHILEALLRLRQICCAPELILGPETANIPSAKVETFMELVRQVVEEGHRVLVFSQFVKVLHILQRRLAAEGIETEYLDGQTRDRLERVERFNKGSTPVFLISLKAGGTGLNLTGADYVIHFDPWWNPAVEDQATDRAHRIGQTRHVFSYKLIAKDTIEEKVVQLQERKRKMVQGVLEGDSFARKLTKEDIDFLFAPT